MSEDCDVVDLPAEVWDTNPPNSPEERIRRLRRWEAYVEEEDEGGDK